MHLRETRWRQLLKLGHSQRPLPRMYHKYYLTQTWTDQLPTIAQDLRRMPSMNYDNVVKLIKRHAATNPWHPYTQGHLYLIYAIGLVFKDEASLFWSYKTICSTLYQYGPDTRQNAIIVPDWVFDSVSNIKLDRTMWDNLVRFRWLYILFGQTFVTPETLCAAWDFVLLDRHRMMCMCAALLEYSAQHTCVQSSVCELERASRLISIQVDSTESAATVLALAQKVQQKRRWRGK